MTLTWHIFTHTHGDIVVLFTAGGPRVARRAVRSQAGEMAAMFEGLLWKALNHAIGTSFLSFPRLAFIAFVSSAHGGYKDDAQGWLWERTSE